MFCRVLSLFTIITFIACMRLARLDIHEMSFNYHASGFKHFYPEKRPVHRCLMHRASTAASSGSSNTENQYDIVLE